MRHRWWVATAALAAAVALGCTGLEARRVPLSRRMAGKDDHIHGFRYYLSRPYLVVSRPIEVAKAEVVTALVEVADTPGTYLLAGKDPAGRRTLFDLSGRPLPPDAPAHASPLKPITLQALGLAPRMAPPKKSDDKEKQPDEKDKKKPDDKDKKKEEDKDKEKKPPLFPKTPGSAIPLTQAAADLARLGAAADKPGTGEAAEQAKDAEPEEPAMKVVYLPDFEEQMAVKHHTIMAKSDFKLAFADGWQLRTVSGSFDSTDVPIKLLDTFRKALSAAGAVETKRLQLRGAAADAGRDVTAFDQALRGVPVKVRVQTRLYIEPGVYRLQKPAEISDPAACGSGLLGNMGVPVAEEVKVLLVK